MEVWMSNSERCPAFCRTGLFLASLLMDGCSTGEAKPLPTPETSRPIKKALILGIDGCRPDALLAARIPNLRCLMENGAFSMAAQTGDIPVSGPGWASLLTGVWREKHGVRDNQFEGADFGEFPDLLTRFKQARPDGFAGAVVHWEPLRTHIIRYADHNAVHTSDAAVGDDACRLLREEAADLLFVHFDDVDHAGHQHGFDPAARAYRSAIERVDVQVGRIVHALRARPTAAREDWLVVVSTDHGGSGKTHGRNVPEDRTIFLIVSGPSALRGAIEPPPDIVDVAPTVLRHLGVVADPKRQLDGKAVGLRERQ
jgi:predicted AlkP superfamily pyrophosphatase or phosphodiesterase